MVSAVPRRPLRLEALEDRSLPASLVTWIGPSGGDWNDAANWDSKSVPGVKDDVVILSGASVTYSRGNSLVHSLSCDGELLVTGGKLGLEQASRISDLQLAGGTLGARGDLTLQGDVVWTAGSLAARGTISVTGEMTVSGRGLKGLGGTLDNRGTITWVGGAVASHATIINEATGTLSVEGNGWFTGDLSNAGRLIVSAPVGFAFDDVDNRGQVELTTGTLWADRFRQESGTTWLDGGVLGSRNAVLFEGGAVKGGGTINADVVNVGAAVQPGGDLRIQGEYKQQDRGTLVVTLAGPASAGTYDRLLVKEAAELGGALIVNQVGVGPADSGRYVIVQADAIEDRFDQVQLVAVPGQQLAVSYDTDSVAIVNRPVEQPPVDKPPVEQPPAEKPPIEQPPQTPPKNDPPPSRPPTTTPPAPTPSAETTPASDPNYVNIGSAGGTPVDATEHLAEHLGGAGSSLGHGEDHNAVTASIVEGTAAVRSLGQAAVVNTVQSSGGATAAGSAASTEAGQASAVGKVFSLSTGLSAGDRASSGRHDSSGLNDLFAVFPMVLPELELPSEGELLSSADIARDLLVGGAARAAILPQAGGQLSGVATLVQGDDPGRAGAPTGESSLAGLFLNPLSLGDSAALAGLTPGAVAAPAEEAADVPPPEANRDWDRVALAATAVAGLAAVQLCHAADERRRGDQPP